MDSVTVSPDFGGTGVSNVGTIKVGGNSELSGAYTFKGTLTGNTDITFPTSGTLATTSSASGVVNSGTANQIAYYATTGTAVSGLTGANSALLVTNGSGVPSMLAGPGANSRALISVNGDVPAWTTCTYPDTITQYAVLYANVTNSISSVVSTPRAVFTTASTGEPTWVPLINGQIVIGSTAGSPAAASLTAGTGITITPGPNSITIAAAATSGEGAKFWIKANGSGVGILDSFNVSSISDIGTGILGIVFTTAFSSADWACLANVIRLITGEVCATAANAGSCTINNYNSAGAAADPTFYFAAGFGDQ